MATPKKSAKPAPKTVKSLPKTPAKSADSVKGGLMGGDDDLDDLEVERLRAQSRVK